MRFAVEGVVFGDDSEMRCVLRRTPAMWYEYAMLCINFPLSVSRLILPLGLVVHTTRCLVEIVVVSNQVCSLNHNEEELANKEWAERGRSDRVKWI